MASNKMSLWIHFHKECVCIEACVRVVCVCAFPYYLYCVKFFIIGNLALNSMFSYS